MFTGSWYVNSGYVWHYSEPKDTNNDYVWLAVSFTGRIKLDLGENFSLKKIQR